MFMRVIIGEKRIANLARLLEYIYQPNSLQSLQNFFIHQLQSQLAHLHAKHDTPRLIPTEDHANKSQKDEQEQAQ